MLDVKVTEVKEENSLPKPISKIIEEVCDEICTKYCKWPDNWTDETNDLCDSEICSNCPLNRLQ